MFMTNSRSETGRCWNSHVVVLERCIPHPEGRPVGHNTVQKITIAGSEPLAACSASYRNHGWITIAVPVGNTLSDITVV